MDKNLQLTKNFKFCPCCKEVKNISEFYKNKNTHDGLQTYCKNCQKEKRPNNYLKYRKRILANHKQYYERNKEEIKKRRAFYREQNRTEIRKRDRLKLQAFNEFKKTLKCEICGYDKCIGALDFHHINKNEKEYAVGRLRKSTMEKILKEKSKCMVLCKNCHYELHYKEQNHEF